MAQVRHINVLVGGDELLAFAVEHGTTVLQVLSLAGGITDRGSDGRIRIQRTARDPCPPPPAPLPHSDGLTR